MLLVITALALVVSVPLAGGRLEVADRGPVGGQVV